MNKQKPSEVISDFLNYIDDVRTEYKAAYDIVGEENRKDQDYKHDIEFAPNKAERNKVATQYQRSRKRRRVNKDKVAELDELIKFLDELNTRNVINKMKQLLGRQRKVEEFLASDRHYNRRGEDD